MMKLGIEILTGTFFYVQVKDNDTVADLRREIAAQENLPCDRLVLFLKEGTDCNRLMNDDELKLVDYGVGHESHVYLCFTLSDSDKIVSPIEGDTTSPYLSNIENSLPTE